MTHTAQTDETAAHSQAHGANMQQALHQHVTQCMSGQAGDNQRGPHSLLQRLLVTLPGPFQQQRRQAQVPIDLQEERGAHPAARTFAGMECPLMAARWMTSTARPLPSAIRGAERPPGSQGKGRNVSHRREGVQNTTRTPHRHSRQSKGSPQQRTPQDFREC